MPEISINHNKQTYILRDESTDIAKVETIDSVWRGDDVFWIYECEGLHTGEPIKIAVKNPHYEPDGDDHEIYYYLSCEGLFWADCFNPLDEKIDDWYYEAVMDAVRNDYKEKK